MSQDDQFQHAASAAIRDFAMTLPQAEEGSSCVNRAFKAGGKNFAFLGEKDNVCSLRLKLKDSLPEVDGRFDVGTSGWTMIRFSPDDTPRTDELERWVVESFRLLAPKKVVALLDT